MEGVVKEFLLTFTGPLGTTFQHMALADDMESAKACAVAMYSSAYFDVYVEECPNYAGPEDFDPDSNLPPWAKSC